MKKGSANRIDAASHFHMKKYSCVIVTWVKALCLFGGGLNGGPGSGDGATEPVLTGG